MDETNDSMIWASGHPTAIPFVDWRVDERIVLRIRHARHADAPARGSGVHLNDRCRSPEPVEWAAVHNEAEENYEDIGNRKF